MKVMSEVEAVSCFTLAKQMIKMQMPQQVQRVFSVFFHTVTKGSNDEGFTISHIPMSDFHRCSGMLQ